MKTAERLDVLLAGVSAEDRIRHRPVLWAARSVAGRYRASRQREKEWRT